MADITNRFAADHGQPDSYEEAKGDFIMDWIAEGLSHHEAVEKWDAKEAKRAAMLRRSAPVRFPPAPGFADPSEGCPF